MALRSIIKTFCLLVLLIISSTLKAQSKIPCPSVNIIQQASEKIDNAVKFDESYIALSSTPVLNENGRLWRIEVELNAKSRKKAIARAKKAVTEINFCEQENAEDPGDGGYFCNYGPVKYALVSVAVVPK